MPLTKRSTIKRQVLQAVAAEERAMSYLLSLRELYTNAGDYPEHTQRLDALLQGLETMTQLTEAFRDFV